MEIKTKGVAMGRGKEHTSMQALGKQGLNKDDAMKGGVWLL